MDWDKTATQPHFHRLFLPRARFIIPATILFLICCFAVPALMGNWYGYLAARIGPVRITYLFALSQFFVVWIVAALYVRATHIFDRDENALIDHTQKYLRTYRTYQPHSIPAQNNRN